MGAVPLCSLRHCSGNSSCLELISISLSTHSTQATYRLLGFLLGSTSPLPAVPFLSHLAQELLDSVSFLIAPSPPLNPQPFTSPPRRPRIWAWLSQGRLSVLTALDPPAASFLAACRNVLFASTSLSVLPQPLFCSFCHHLTPTAQGGGPGPVSSIYLLPWLI